MNRNGMGPNNEGPMTGKKMGFCRRNVNGENYRSNFCRNGALGRGFEEGWGFGQGRGFRQGFGNQSNCSEGLWRAFSDKEVEAFVVGPEAKVYTRKDILNEQKDYYEKKLNDIKQELEEIK